MNPQGFSLSRSHSGRCFTQHQTTIFCICLMLISLVSTARPVLADIDSDAKIAGMLANLQLLEQETTSASVLIDSRRFNYDAIIKEVGNHPKDLYQWVKANTRPLPYRGILKGAWGVLIERQGNSNSIDRSLLLAELLDRAGHRVELVHSTLNNRALSIAKDLVLDGLEEPPVVGATSDSAWTKEDLVEHQATLAELAGTSPEAALKETVQKEIKTFTEITRLIGEANKQTEALMRKLPMDDRSPTPLLNDALASLEDHWWVELTADAETEVFDFFFEQGASTLAELGYTKGDRIVFTRENVPENLYHHITFRIIADQITAKGESQSRTAFSHTLRTAESRLKPIQLSFIAMKYKVGASEELISSPDASRKNLAKQDEWLPALKIGQKTFAEAVIRADGTLDLEPKLQRGPLQGILGPSYTPVQDSHLAAVRLEIDIVGGGIKTTESRVLFDYRDRLAAANASQEKQKKEDAAAAAAAAAATATAAAKAEAEAEAEAIVSKEKELRAELVAKEQACSEDSGVAIEKVRILRNAAEAYGDIELYASLVVWNSCYAVEMAYVYAKDVPLKAQAEAMIFMAGDKQKADLNERRQQCSKQSGFALEDLLVLEKGADRDTWESENLFEKIMESDKCFDLVKRLHYPAAYFEPAKKTVYKITSDPPARSSKQPGLSEELRVSRAANFMTVQQFLVLPFNVPDAYIAEQLRGTALYYQKVLVKLLNGKHPLTAQKLRKELENYDASALKLLSFATLRQQPDTGGDFAITQANLVSKLGMISFKQSNAELTVGIDIVANNILPLSRDAERGRQTAIRQGVLDTLIENHLVAGGQDSTNTASQFHSDLEKNDAIEWVAAQINIEPQTYSRVNLKHDPETLPVLVYSPLRLAAEPASTSFWLINMKTGQTLGYSNNGRGSAIGFIISIGNVLNNGKTMMAFAKCFAQAAIERCKVMGCIAKGMGHYLSSGVEGVFGAALPSSSVNDLLGIFTPKGPATHNFLLQQLGMKILDEKVTSKVLAQIVATTDELAESTNRLMCGLGQAEPSIKSTRSATN